MKRAMVLMLALLLSLSSAYAKGEDLSSLSINDLILLRNQVEKALQQQVDGLFGASAKATPPNDFLYSTNGKEIMINAYNGNDTDVAIPEYIDGVVVTMIGDCAFRNNETISSVLLPSSVRSIGEESFYECKSLEYINVDNVEIIGERALSSTGLDCVLHFVSDNLTLDDSAFWYANIRGVVIDSRNVHMHIRAFGDCDHLEFVHFSKNTTIDFEDNSSDTWAVFEDCRKLKCVIVPDLIKGFPSALFVKCPNLTIYTQEGSQAQKYASDSFIPYNTEQFDDMYNIYERAYQ